MNEPVFMDTGFWIALIDQQDQHHLAAKKILPRLLQLQNLFLSDFIVFETLTYLNCSVRCHDLAISFLEKTKSSVFSIFTVDEPIKSQALDWFKRYSDKDLSITDCTSFVLMHLNQIQYYAGFDDHFKQMGYLSLISSGL